MKPIEKFIGRFCLIWAALFASCRKENNHVAFVPSPPSVINKPPVARAGPDRTIALPKDSVWLDGSGSTDPDNNIIHYLWTRISGPGLSTVTNANSVQAQVANLVEGTYQFELKVMDADSLFSTDTINVTVNLGSTCSNNRALISTQLTPVTNIPPGTPLYAGVINNKMFFLGWDCFDCEDTTKKRAYFNIYDLVTQTWSVSRTNQVTPRWGALVTAGDKIFFAGGYNTDGTTYAAVFPYVDIYNASSDTWSSASLSAARYSLTTAVVGNKILFAGGLSQTSSLNYYTYDPSNAVDIYNLATNTWSRATISEARSDMSAVTVGDKIYFSGGAIEHFGAGNYSPPTFTDRIDVYDNISGQWSVSSLNQPKSQIAGIVVGNKIFWAGGANSFTSFNNNNPWGLTASVEIKDIGTNSSSIMCLFEPNGASHAVLKNTQIIFFTGTGAVRNKFDIYDITSNTWSIGVLNQDLVGSIVSVNNIIYVANSQQIWRLEF